MYKFLGLPLMCLMFTVSYAEDNNPNFYGKSWSVNLSQDGDEPIQVISDSREFNENGIIEQTSKRGIIEDGKFKQISQYKTPHAIQYAPCKVKWIRFNDNNLSEPTKDQNPHMVIPQNFDQQKFGSNVEDRFRNRSRVSFYRPIEKLFSGFFGNKDSKRIHDFEQNYQAKKGFFPNKSMNPCHKLNNRNNFNQMNQKRFGKKELIQAFKYRQEALRKEFMQRLDEIEEGFVSIISDLED